VLCLPCSSHVSLPCFVGAIQQDSTYNTSNSNALGLKRRRSTDGAPGTPRSAAAASRHRQPSLAAPPSPRRRDALVQALTTGFANRIARRMQRHNGYRTMAESGQLAQLHPGSSHLATDEDGLLPEWVMYYEFVATSRPFLRQVRSPSCGGGCCPWLPCCTALAASARRWCGG
jgi:hypothetical protein